MNIGMIIFIVILIILIIIIIRSYMVNNNILTKLADAKANPRSHALVNYFLDNIATAPVQPI